MSIKGKAQSDISVGIGSAAIGGALIAGYYVLTAKELKSYTHITDEKAAIKESKKQYRPYLFIGIGCEILSTAAFSNGIHIGKKKKIVANFTNNGLSLSYAIR